MDSNTTKDFPIIDISRISHKDSQLAIAKQILQASRSWGFFLLRNGPIPASSIKSMFGLSRRFFVDNPEDQKAAWPVNGSYIGYNHPLTDSKRDDKASMWLSGKPGVLDKDLDALPPFWREHIREVEDFKHACHTLVLQLLVCIALAMDLPDRNFFANAHAHTHLSPEDVGNRFRLVYYPSRDSSPVTSETKWRMSEHSDSNSLTLLFQSCPGLEILSPSGQWTSAPHLDNHILVNFGDALAFWSGGRIKATKHRVTFDTVPFDRERLTIAYFGLAAPSTVLKPLVDGKEEAMGEYVANGLVIRPGITVGEYSRMIMESIYGSSVAAKKEI